jgi:hypothetical protein
MHLLVDSTGLKLYGAGEWLDLPLRVEGIDQNIRPPFAW